jgi:preprotein translocase subunit SecD
MITGKNSALKGFALFAWAVIAILVLIPCVNYNAFFGIVGLANLVINSIVIVKLFTHFSGEK